MPRKPATEAQKAESRHIIQKAATKLYRENGLNGISARSVAETANVSVGKVYSHFGNLTGLMQSLWTEPVERQNEVFEQVARDEADPLKRLKALLESYVAFARSKPELYRAALMFVRPQTMEQPDKAPPTSVTFSALLEQAIRDGQARGQFRDGQADLMSALCWAAIHGAIALPINMDRVDFGDTHALTGRMIDGVLESLTAQQTERLETERV